MYLNEVYLPPEALANLRRGGNLYSTDVNPETNEIEVTLNDALDFEYEVRPQAYLRPAFSLSETGDDENSKYFRAEVHLREGGQDYDVMGWSREQVLSDMLDQYEKHLHFLHVVRE